MIVNVYMGIDVVYTHIFYIPIILAGLWYGRKAIYVALFLGIVHILINIFVTPSTILDSIIRAIIFLLVALVVGRLSEEKDLLNKKLNDSNDSLLDSNKELSTIIEFYPDATLVIDNYGKVVAWNHAIEVLTGVKANDIIGKDNFEYSLPFYGERRPMLIDLLGENSGNIAAGYTDVTSRNNVIEASVDKVNVRGKDLILWLSATRLFGTDGRPMGAIESMRNVTNNFHTEEKLRESEEMFRSLVESSHDLIYIVDNSHRLTYVNHFAAESQECQDNELVGKSISVLFKGGFIDIEHRSLVAAFESAEPLAYDDKARLFNRESWVHTQLVPLKTRDGAVKAIMGVSRDITGHKSLEWTLLLKNNELEIVNSIISTINGSKDTNNMLNSTLNNLLGLLKMDEGTIYMNDEESPGLKLMSQVVKSTEERLPAPVQWIDTSHGALDKFYASKNGYVQCDEVFNGVTASVCVPIFLKEEIIGIMAFYSADGGDMRVDPKLFTGIVSQLAIAIENHRMFERMSYTSTYLADIINESPDAVITVDQAGKILSFNKSASRLLHYVQDEIIGKNIAVIMPGGERLELEEDSSFVRDFVARDDTGIQLNISMSRLYKDDAKSSYIITLKNLSEINGLKITPSAENALETRQLYHFEPGSMYMVDKAMVKNYMDIFADQVNHNIQGLFVTRQNPQKVREHYGLEKTPIVWLNASDGAANENCIKPDNLSGLGATLSKFISEVSDGLILLDGTEYLMTRNSFDSLLKFVNFLNDRLVQSRCRILFCIDGLALDEKQLHILLSEMNKFVETEARADTGKIHAVNEKNGGSDAKS